MAVNYTDLISTIQRNNFLKSFAILAAFFIISKLFVYITQKIILKLVKKTKTQIDDVIVNKTNKPISILLILIGIRLSLFPLGLNQITLDILENIILSLIIADLTFIAVVAFDAIIDEWGKRFADKTDSELDKDILILFHRFSRIFLFIIGFLFILPLWGIQIGPLITSLGIAGIAVAFALQSTLGNIFGGVSLILDRSIKVGDVIKLDNDTIGTVVDVGLRSTKIKTFDNELIILPNGKLADTKIMNYLQPDPKVRCAIEFGVEYGSDVDDVKKIVLDAINSMPNVLKNPEDVHAKIMFMEMGDFALKFRALFWVSTFDERFPTKEIALEKIYNSLRKHKIGIPFPTRTVYLSKINKK